LKVVGTEAKDARGKLEGRSREEEGRREERGELD